MAEALIKGFIASRKTTPDSIVASDSASDRLAHMAKRYGIRVTSKNFEAAALSDIIFLCVKPKDLEAALKDIASELAPEKALVSIIAGKTTDSIMETLKAAGLKHHLTVIRTMPNTPALIGEGVIGLFTPHGVPKAKRDGIIELMGSVGAVFEVANEELLDSVTGLSGSGPAYVFLFIEALIEAGVKQGLPVEQAREMAIKTVSGAASLALETGKDMGELIKNVSSPGGTTIEGLKALEKGLFKESVSEAVCAATRRAKEISGTKN